VKVGTGDYLAQFELAKRVARVLDESTGAVLGSRSLRAQLQDVKAPAGSAAATALAAFTARLDTWQRGAQNGTAPPASTPERVNGMLAGLYGAITAADARPTRTQTEAAAQMITEWQSIGTVWEQLRGQALMELNATLKRAHLSALRLDLAAPRALDQVDEE
jgi:hypothetical protein